MDDARGFPWREHRSGRRPADAAMDRHLANMKALHRFPGVTRVGFGLKEVAGEVVPDWAYRVYVERKHLAADLADGDLIPVTVDGVRTDVLVGFPGDTMPLSGHTCAPGDQIHRVMPGSPTETGTFGLLVQQGATRFVLTNDHVLDDKVNVTEFTRDIYSPDQKTVAGFACNKPSAHLTESHGVQEYILFEEKKFFVDATIAPLYEGVKATNVVPDIGPLNQGLRDLVGVAPPPGQPPTPPLIQVAKRGAVTHVTRGLVVEFFHDIGPVGNPDFVGWQLTVKTDAANGREFHKDYQLAPGQDTTLIESFFAGQSVHAQIKNESGKQTLSLTGHVFSLAGDSGSCLVDSTRRIVGLHYAGGNVPVRVIVDGAEQEIFVPNGRGVASYIRPVFNKMGLSEQTGVVVPATAASGAAPAFDEDRWETPESAALDHLEKTLAGTRAGQRLRRLWKRFGEDLAELVHHRRRVLVTWHRAQGPGHAAALLRALTEPGGGLPTEVGGVRLVDSLVRMREVLLREGEADLRQAIAEHGDFILALARRATSIPELSRALAEMDDAWSLS